MTDLQTFTARLQTQIKTLPTVLKNIALNFFLDRFTQQAWIDTARQRWADRSKKKKFPSARQGTQGEGRAILIKTGRLRRSIRAVFESDSRIVIATDVVYAAVHNFGAEINHAGGTDYVLMQRGKNKGKARFITQKKAAQLTAKNQTVKQTTAHKIKIPQRQFIGNSEFLNKLLLKGALQHLGFKA